MSGRYKSSWRGFNDGRQDDPSAQAPLDENIIEYIVKQDARVQALSKDNVKQLKQINLLRSEIDKFRLEISGSDTRKGIREEIDSLSSNIRSVRDKTMEPLAVFVGLFTFASIGFQIFANIHDFEVWPGLLLIVAGFIIIFASLIIHAGSLANDVKDRRQWTAVLICLGVLSVILGSWLHVQALHSLEGKAQKDCINVIKDIEDVGDKGIRYCKAV